MRSKRWKSPRSRGKAAAGLGFTQPSVARYRARCRDALEREELAKADAALQHRDPWDAPTAREHTQALIDDQSDQDKVSGFDCVTKDNQ